MNNKRIEELVAERDLLLSGDYRAALDLAGFDTAHPVLDVGTGSGRMLSELVARGHRVVSVDVDPQAFEKARARLGELECRVSFRQMDARSLQFADNTFHAVTFANAVHEIENPRAVIDEIARVLTGDGKLLVVEFNSAGFEMIELHHKLEGKEDHPRGEMTTADIDSYLREKFAHIQTSALRVTHAWVALGKRKQGST